MANHIWVVERSADGGNTWSAHDIAESDPEDETEALTRAIAFTDISGKQFRVRKYIPEPDK